MRGYPERNVHAFDSAARRLRARGYEVFNPAELAEPENNAAMAAELAYVCCEADAVIVLPGFTASRGALAEVLAAWAVDKPAYRFGSFILSGRLAKRLTPDDLSD